LIEILDAVHGGKVIRYNGRLLASRFDPRREAEEWIGSRSEFIADVRHIIVLGLGSGHHVQALVENSSARILILEADQNIADACAGLHAFDSARVNIELISSARALRSSAAVKAAVKESFIVLAHPASLAFNPALYESCRDQLLGRDWGTLSWQWKMRSGPNFDANPRIDSNKSEPLTIYDLEQTELVQSSEEREKLLLKALRELVK
jgi:hypothetical protein